MIAMILLVGVLSAALGVGLGWHLKGRANPPLLAAPPAPPAGTAAPIDAAARGVQLASHPLLGYRPLNAFVAERG